MSDPNQEEQLYAQASDELDSGNRNEGLWAKCFAECNGDENKAKALYLKTRVGRLTGQLSVEQQAAKGFSAERKTIPSNGTDSKPPILFDSRALETNENDIVFDAPAKWEQHIMKHSPGRLQMASDSIQFHPGTLSLMGKLIIIPLGAITSINEGDNVLWRGVIKINLESEINGANQFIFFLGSKRSEFMKLYKKMRAGIL